MGQSVMEGNINTSTTNCYSHLEKGNLKINKGTKRELPLFSFCVNVICLKDSAPTGSVNPAVEDVGDAGDVAAGGAECGAVDDDGGDDDDEALDEEGALEDDGGGKEDGAVEEDGGTNENCDVIEDLAVDDNRGDGDDGAVDDD